MFKKRCTLCGGELSRGICQECGLDNKKKRMSQIDDMNGSSSEQFGSSWGTTSSASGNNGGSEISNEEFFAKWKEEQREMEQEDVYHRGEHIDYSKPKTRGDRSIPNKQPTRTPYQSTQNQEKQKKSPIRRVISGVFIFYFIMNIIGAVVSVVIESTSINLDSAFEYIGDGLSGLAGGDYAEDLEDYEWINEISYPDESEYPYVLEETGESFSESFTAGMYTVGVHIPEGTYSIECLSKGSIYVQDSENMVYFSNYYMEENIGDVHDGIMLYQGAKVQMSDESIFELTSSNANLEDMVGMENPNTDVIRCTETIVAGVDFEPGVYDISVPEGSFTIVELYDDPELVNDEEAYPIVQWFLSDTDFDETYEIQPSSYKNVVIPEGYAITVGEDNIEQGYCEYVELAPSQVIVDEEYGSYYEMDNSY